MFKSAVPPLSGHFSFNEKIKVWSTGLLLRFASLLYETQEISPSILVFFFFFKSVGFFIVQVQFSLSLSVFYQSVCFAAKSGPQEGSLGGPSYY